MLLKWSGFLLELESRLLGPSNPDTCKRLGYQSSFHLRLCFTSMSGKHKYKNLGVPAISILQGPQIV